MSRSKTNLKEGTMAKGRFDKNDPSGKSVYEGLNKAHQDFLEDLGGCLNGKKIPRNFKVQVHNRGNSCGDYCWNGRKWICC
jgi:hypothetical protein